MATLKVKEGKLAEALEILKDFSAWIARNEPGTLQYSIHTVKGKETNTIVVYERYKDAEAFSIHGKHLGEQAGGLIALLDGGLDIKTLVDA
ncbi:MAG: antibiotic biosynthesis monooxygenase [Candidatus Lokiarchaeota archaeon]|nr:antibiotic biosynthesis monooxygenase [Candidatus Lokiarchaeota archaeon]